MATLKFTKNASRIVLKSVMDSKPPTEELNNLKDEVKFLKDILHIKRFGGGISELIYKVKELQTENDKLKKLSINPKSQLQHLMNQNLILQQELTKYRHQSPSDYQEQAGLDFSENQSLAKDLVKSHEPHQTYIIKSFIGNNKTVDGKSDSPSDPDLGEIESNHLATHEERAIAEEPTELRVDYKIPTLNPDSQRKSHPALFSPREDSERINKRNTTKEFRASDLEQNETLNLNFALKNIKLSSPGFSVKSGTQTIIGRSNLSASEKNQKAQKYLNLNASSSRNYLKSQLLDPSSKQNSSIFSTGKPVSVKRSDSQDALVLVEDLIQKRMIKKYHGGPPSLKHSKFRESPRAEDYLARHLDRHHVLSREVKTGSSRSPKQLAPFNQTQALDHELQKSLKTADLLHRLQELSALGTEPSQNLSTKKNNYLEANRIGHLFPLVDHRSPTSSPTKPHIRSSQPTGIFLGKVESNMREMKRELEKLRFS
jgi:hypothetical protein